MQLNYMDQTVFADLLTSCIITHIGKCPNSVHLLDNFKSSVRFAAVVNYGQSRQLNLAEANCPSRTNEAPLTSVVCAIFG